MLTIQLNKDGTYTIDLDVHSKESNYRFCGVFKRVESATVEESNDSVLTLRVRLSGEEADKE